MAMEISPSATIPEQPPHLADTTTVATDVEMTDADQRTPSPPGTASPLTPTHEQLQEPVSNGLEDLSTKDTGADITQPAQEDVNGGLAQQTAGPNAEERSLAENQISQGPATNLTSAQAQPHTNLVNEQLVAGSGASNVSAFPASGVGSGSSPMPTEAVPHGAPARRYLNEKVTGALLVGMKKLVTEQPANPLKALGDFLLLQSQIYESPEDSEEKATERA